MISARMKEGDGLNGESFVSFRLFVRLMQPWRRLGSEEGGRHFSFFLEKFPCFSVLCRSLCRQAISWHFHFAPPCCDCPFFLWAHSPSSMRADAAYSLHTRNWYCKFSSGYPRNKRVKPGAHCNRDIQYVVVMRLGPLPYTTAKPPRSPPFYVYLFISPFTRLIAP